MAVIEDLGAFFKHRDDHTHNDHPQYRRASVALGQADMATGLRLTGASTGAPSSPSRGDIWIDTDANNFDLQVYYGATTGWGKPWNLPWGPLGYAEITAASASISSLADVSGLSVTFTAVANRRYKTTFYMSTQLSGTPQDEEMYIDIADGSNNIIQQGRFTPPLTTKNAPALSVIHVNNATFSAGSRTHKIRGQALTGSFSIYAAAVQPAFILVEDIGPLGNAPTV